MNLGEIIVLFKYWSKGLIFFVITLFLIIGCSEDTVEKNNYNGPLFTLLSKEKSKVIFINDIPESPQMNIIVYPSLYSGAVVPVWDINNDGLPDLFFTKNFGDNHLYVNKGNLVFEEIGKEAGVVGNWGWATGSSMVDINGDGYLDIYLSKSGDIQTKHRKNEIYINQGDLTFKEQSGEYVLYDAGYANQSVFFDYDKDGNLDVAIARNMYNPEVETPRNDAANGLLLNQVFLRQEMLNV